MTISEYAPMTDNGRIGSVVSGTFAVNHDKFLKQKFF